MPTNQTIILIHNFNFDEKSDSRNLAKMKKLHHFFKNQNPIETKKTLEDQLDIFERK